MLEDLEQGDVAQTISTFFEKSKTIEPLEKCELSLHDVDQYLAKLSGVTKEEDQQHVLQKVRSMQAWTCTEHSTRDIFNEITAIRIFGIIIRIFSCCVIFCSINAQIE